MRSRKRYHETLGVPKDASPAEVKRAYRALVMELHPDRMRDPELARRAEERLKEINAAWSDFLAERRTPPESSARTAPTRRAARPRAAEEPDAEGRPSPSSPSRRRDRESRDRHRSERARWLREREERERRAREHADALRHEREVENYERRLDQRDRSLRLLRLALAALAAAVAACVVLLLAMAFTAGG